MPRDEFELSALGKVLQGKIEEATKKYTVKEFKKINKTLEKVSAYVTRNLRTEMVVEVPDTGVILGRVEGLFHENFKLLVTLLQLRFHVLLTGPTGSGKTTAAEQAAKALNLKFASLSVGQQTSKSDILGFINANGIYMRTAFRNAYEKGGLFVIDEVDAGNSNVLVIMNSALSNGYCSFPDKQITRHKDFRLVATANTFGRGRDLDYVGRNPIDLATLDRFVTLDWPYSEKLELSISPKIFELVLKVRNEIAEKKLNGFISTRTAYSIDTLWRGGVSIRQSFRICLYNKFSSLKDYDHVISVVDYNSTSKE